MGLRGLVCLNLLLPVNDFFLTKYPAVNHLLGIKLQLTFVRDGNSGGLEVFLLFLEILCELDDVQALVRWFIKSGGRVLDLLGFHLASGAFKILEIVSHCDLLVAH